MEIARRSGGVANAPVEGGDVRLEKSTISCQSGSGGVLFFRNFDNGASAFRWRRPIKIRPKANDLGLPRLELRNGSVAQTSR